MPWSVAVNIAWTSSVRTLAPSNPISTNGSPQRLPRGTPTRRVEVTTPAARRSHRP
ncbi:malate synthase [Methylobacterium radiotolerans]